MTNHNLVLDFIKACKSIDNIDILSWYNKYYYSIHITSETSINVIPTQVLQTVATSIEVNQYLIGYKFPDIVQCLLNIKRDAFDFSSHKTIEISLPDIIDSINRTIIDSVKLCKITNYYLEIKDIVN